MSSGADDDREILAAIQSRTTQMMREPLAAQARISAVVGVGRSDDGLLVAKADAGGAIVSLTLDPRVMRRDADRLAEDVTLVAKAAQRDSWQQALEILDGVSLPQVTPKPLGESLAYDGAGQAVSAILRRVEEMYGAVAGADREERGMHDFIETKYGELEGMAGTGASASGHVTAVADAQGKVSEITIEPRAMRLDSHVLADEIVAAVRDARRDAVSKVEEKMLNAFPDLDPAADAEFLFQDGTRQTRR
ncbi:YbaB/EbfC family nucleoid-associated protein [Nonomuraea sp. B19D2]|uniref:YbaB/EbfC family nucleoid-associated protein n=1 Tax=Nonomuraea sp. B19D2 TaxID=3159561 RepID=UPI0032DABDDA